MAGATLEKNLTGDSEPDAVDAEDESGCAAAVAAAVAVVEEAEEAEEADDGSGAYCALHGYKQGGHTTEACFVAGIDPNACEILRKHNVCLMFASGKCTRTACSKKHLDAAMLKAKGLPLPILATDAICAPSCVAPPAEDLRGSESESDDDDVYLPALPEPGSSSARPSTALMGVPLALPQAPIWTSLYRNF